MIIWALIILPTAQPKPHRLTQRITPLNAPVAVACVEVYRRRLSVAHLTIRWYVEFCSALNVLQDDRVMPATQCHRVRPQSHTHSYQGLHGVGQ